MRDPHVESLRCRLEMEDGEFVDPDRIHHETNGFRFTLQNDELVVEMKDHFAFEQDARAEVETFLRAWEIDAALRQKGLKNNFVFEDLTVVDRDPTPGRTTHSLSARAEGVSHTSDATLTVDRGACPEPPQHFRWSPDVETLWHRYQG